MHHHLTLEYGDDVLFSMGLSRDEFDEEARFLLAAKLYELGCLTSGQAAQLCGRLPLLATGGSLDLQPPRRGCGTRTKIPPA
jgi:hypothetical protein